MHRRIGATAESVQTYAQARLTAGAVSNVLNVSGKLTPADTGAAQFVWVEGTAVDNDSTILSGPVGSGGHWVRTLANGIGGDALAGSYNYAGLRLITADEGDVANCYGRVTSRDGGQGQFVFRLGAATDNGGTRLVVSAIGYWDRLDVIAVSPYWFGAGGRGLADDLAALVAASAVVQSLSLTGTGYTANFTRPFLDLGTGVYLLSAAFTLPMFTRGDGAILRASSAANDIITGLSYRTYVNGVQFEGGRTAVAIMNGSIDTSLHHFEYCEFQNQAGPVFTSDNNSSPMMVVIQKCKIIHFATTGYFMDFLSGDRIRISECRIYATQPLRYGCCSIATSRNLWTPSALSGGYWFECNDPTGQGNCWRSDGDQFGGEIVGRGVLRVTGPEATFPAKNRVLMNNSSASSDGSKYAFEFDYIPHDFRVTGNSFNSGYKGILFNASCASPALGARSDQYLWDIETNLQEPLAYHGDITAIQFVQQLTRSNDTSHKPPLAEADLVIKKAADNAGDGLSSSGAGAASGTSGTSSITGEPVIVYAASDADEFANSVTTQWTTLLSTATTNAPYTAVFNVEVTGHVQCQFLASTEVAIKELTTGRHTISIPFFYKAAASQKVGYSVTKLTVLNTLTIHGIRIFKAHVRCVEWGSKLKGSAIPTTRTWEVGDCVDDGGPGFVCQKRGTPGTWTPLGPRVFKATGVNLLATGQTELIPALTGRKFLCEAICIVPQASVGTVVVRPIVRVGNNGTFDNVAADWTVGVTAIDAVDSVASVSAVASVASAVSFSVKTAGTGASALTADVYCKGILL